MSANDPIEIAVVVHVDKPDLRARRISLDGEDSKAVWLPKSLIRSFEATGKEATRLKTCSAWANAAVEAKRAATAAVIEKCLVIESPP